MSSSSAPPPPTKPGKGMGHAYLFSGKDGELLLTLAGKSEGDRFGSAVCGYSDGRQIFLVVGAPKAGPEKHGRVYVYDRLADNRGSRWMEMAPPAATARCFSPSLATRTEMAPRTSMLFRPAKQCERALYGPSLCL